MPALAPEEVLTKEVLSWKGVHLFYADFSVCSRKVQLGLSLKNVEFTPHVLDLGNGGNRTEHYLGINPRGLVPCLVHDGVVIIESNDILMHIDQKFPLPALMPTATTEDKEDSEILKLLDDQDAYHMDIRNLTFRYILPASMVQAKARTDLNKMLAEEKAGLKDVAGGGQGRAHQLEFYQRICDEGGIRDETVMDSVSTFRRVLGPIDKAYANKTNLVGGKLTLVDIAFWCDIERLLLCGFPVDKEFPNMHKMYSSLKAQLPEDVLALGNPLPIRVFQGLIAPYRWACGSRLADMIQGRKPTSAIALAAPVVGLGLGVAYYVYAKKPINK